MEADRRKVRGKVRKKREERKEGDKVKEGKKRNALEQEAIKVDKHCTAIIFIYIVYTV